MAGLYDVGEGTGIYRPLSKKTPTEYKIVKQTTDLLKKTFPGIVIIKTHGGAYQRAGIPDLYIAYSGVSLWVEMKRPGADTTALQRAFLTSLIKQGIYAGTSNSPELTVEMLQSLLLTK